MGPPCARIYRILHMRPWVLKNTYRPDVAHGLIVISLQHLGVLVTGARVNPSKGRVNAWINSEQTHGMNAICLRRSDLGSCRYTWKPPNGMEREKLTRVPSRSFLGCAEHKSPGTAVTMHACRAQMKVNGVVNG